MKKKILGFVVTLALLNFISCSQDNYTEENSDNEMFPKALNRDSASNDEYVYDFVKKHVEINDKIFSILESETNINSKILDKYLSKDITSEDEFKNILQESGVKRFNELGGLMLLQVENSKILHSKNPTFIKLDKIEQDAILTKYIDQMFSNNYQVTGKCEHQREKDRSRCERNSNKTGALALLGCVGGPVICGLGLVAVMMVHTDCIKDAEVDYKDCLKGL